MVFLIIFVLVISIYLVIGPIIDKPQIEYLYAVLFILAGLIFYIPFVKYGMTPRFMGKSIFKDFLFFVNSFQFFATKNRLFYEQKKSPCSFNYCWKLYRHLQWVCLIEKYFIEADQMDINNNDKIEILYFINEIQHYRG